jgi:hypothetical protein
LEWIKGCNCLGDDVNIKRIEKPIILAETFTKILPFNQKKIMGIKKGEKR